MIAQNNFKDKIFEAYNESERLSQKAKAKTIVKGSDEHLDLISEKKPALDSIIDVLDQVNQLVEDNFPSTSIDEANEVKQSLHMLHSSVKMFYENMKSIKFYAESFPKCLNNLEAEVNQLEEYIQDINNYVLSDDKFISDDLIEEINGL